MRIWPFSKKKTPPVLDPPVSDPPPPQNYEDTSLSAQESPSSLPDIPYVFEDSSFPEPLIPSGETSWLSAHSPKVGPPQSGDWVPYQFQGELDPHQVPETKVVNSILPPHQSHPPRHPPHHSLNEEISEVSDPYRMVFRSTNNEEIYEDSVSDRTLGPVWIPSLLETASMYRRWVVNHGQEDPYQARDMWREYLDIRPDDLQASTDYAWLLYQFDGFEDAFKFLEEQLDTISDFDDVEQRKIHLLSKLGTLAQHEGKYDLSIQYFTELNTLLPDDLQCLKTLMFLHKKAGYQDLAYEVEIQIRELQDEGWHGAQKK